MEATIEGKGRIKIGVRVYQDFRFTKWPDDFQNSDPRTVFDVVWTGGWWECKADGYGYMRHRGEDGEYGNGILFIRNFDHVEIVIGRVVWKKQTQSN